MFWRAFVVLALLTSPAFAATFGHSASVITPTAETVTANLASTSNTIPANMFGVSEEVNDFIGLGIFGGSSGTSLCGLMGMLGTNGVLHVGGGTQDTAIALTLTSGEATTLANYLACLGSGWTLVYGLDYTVNNTTDAVNTAGLIIGAVGINNVIFTIGGEETFGTAYTTEWNNYYAALTAAYPTIKFGDPEGYNDSDVQIETAVNTLTPGEAGLSYVSYHHYEGSGYYDPANVFLSSACGRSWTTGLNTYASGKVVISEMNSEASHGYPGLSDRMTASAYFINTMMSLASQGFAGAYWHNVISQPGVGHNPGWYNAFVQQTDGGWSPSPLFYGELMFSKMEGQTIVATTKSGSGNVCSMATVGSHGNANILVVNNDAASPVVVTPAQSNSWSTAKYLDVEPLTSQGCFDAQAQAGGAPIGEGGAWTGTWKTLNNGGTVTLQPCGAVVVQIQP